MSAQVELYGVGGGPGHGGLHLPAGERQEAAALAPPLQRALQVLRTATVTEIFFYHEIFFENEIFSSKIYCHGHKSRTVKVMSLVTRR